MFVKAPATYFRCVEPTKPTADKQERLFKEAAVEDTIEADERFLELDTSGGILEWEAKRRIDKLRTKQEPDWR